MTNVMFNINNKKAVQLSGGRKGLEQIIDKVKLQEEGCFQVLVILCVFVATTVTTGALSY